MESIKINSDKINCECGSCYSKANKLKHISSNKHQNFINNSNENSFNVACLCGGRYTPNGITRHFSSKLHKFFMMKHFPVSHCINPNTKYFINGLYKKEKKTYLELTNKII